VTAQSGGNFLSSLGEALSQRVLGAIKGTPVPGSVDEQAWQLYRKSLEAKPTTERDLAITRNDLRQTGLNNLDLQQRQTQARLKTLGAPSELAARGTMIGQNTNAITQVVGAKSSAEAARASEQQERLNSVMRHETALAGGSDMERMAQVLQFAGTQDDKNRELQAKMLDQYKNANTLNLLGNLAMTAASFFA
jgi:hypothetical protein